MEIREINVKANMDGFGIPNPISGVLFGGEDQAHKFIVTDQSGEAFSGTVTAKFLRYADNATVPLTGSIEDGKATVTLIENCYYLPGRFKLTIYVTAGGSTTAVYCCMGTVDRTDGQRTIDPSGEINLDVTDLINRINAATASVPADYIALLATIAPDFSASTGYASGEYVWYSGTLYRFTADHAAGTWTGTDVTAAVIGQDVSKLKTELQNEIQDTARSPILSALDALTEKQALDYTAIATQAAPLGWELGYIGPDGRQMGSSRYMRSLVIGGEILDNVDCITVTPPEDRFCWISVFNEDNSLDAQYGTYDEGHRYNGVPVSAPLKHGQWCRISLGRFNGDAGNYLTAAFIATIRCELRQIRERSRFAGKTLSLLGDSLSAFAEDIPEGNKAYYPNEHAGVTDRSQMWYNVLCDRLGMTPLVINAWSGSCVTYGVRNDTTYLPASSPERCQALHSGTTMPDVILVAMGANDYSYMASESQFGSWDGTTPLGSETDMSDYATDTFRAAYATMLARIRKAYPDAQVVCITPWFIQRRATDTGVTYLNAIGLQESDYGDAIRDIARIMGCQVIDSGVAGFNRDNYYPTYCQDSSTTPAHPNAAGQARIGEAIAMAMTRGTNSPGGVDLVGQVRYDRGQALSAAQKATARGNMGLSFADSGDGEIVIS